MELLEYLRLFHPITQTDFELLAQYLKPKTFQKGDLMVRPEQIQKELYFVKKGVQMSFFETENKSHVVAFTYSPSPCAIPDSFMFQKASVYSLVCLTESEVDCISYAKLQEVFDASQAIERLFRKMTEYLLSGMIERHIELHSLTIEERFKAFCKRSPHLLQLVPHKYIASYLHIDPTNFSKLWSTIKL